MEKRKIQKKKTKLPFKKKETIKNCENKNDRKEKNTVTTKEIKEGFSKEYDRKKMSS